jgi:HPt (histidine-containing phosphotransfer) domain-containing protein
VKSHDGPADGTSTTFQIERLREMTDGDPDMERDLIDLFISEVKERIATIETALADTAQVKSVFDTVREEAHGLKGSSGNIGAVAIQEIARELEQQGGRLDRDGVGQALHRLQLEFEAVRQYLDAYVETLSTATMKAITGR